MNITIELQPCLNDKSGIGIYTYELVKCLQHYENLNMTGTLFNFLNRKNVEASVRGLDFKKKICRLLPYRYYCTLWDYIPIKYSYLFKREADITHFFNFIVPPYVKGKVISCIHDISFLLYPETMDAVTLQRIRKNIVRSVECSDKIITISQNTKKDLIETLKVPREKIEIIYPGVDQEKFNRVYSTIEKIMVRKKYNLPDIYMLYMGTLEPRKNIESIIQAFNLYNQKNSNSRQTIKLVIAGKKGWLYESIFKQVESLGLQEYVIFTNYIDEEDKPCMKGLEFLY